MGAKLFFFVSQDVCCCLVRTCSHVLLCRHVDVLLYHCVVALCRCRVVLLFRVVVLLYCVVVLAAEHPYDGGDDQDDAGLHSLQPNKSFRSW